MTNKGKRRGKEIAEVYAALPSSSGEPPKRLVGWQKVDLAAGESKQVVVSIDARSLSIYDAVSNGWKVVPGRYTFSAGGSSQDLPLTGDVTLGQP